jgi:NAD(P)-dependent dehydrogenase (short-subunit alcohol dehydrogenase family)
MSRTALVIGAAGGMGAEIAKALVADGYRVLATVLNDKEAQTDLAIRIKLGNPCRD